MRQYSTLNDIETEYFQDHPEEIEAYLTEIFEEYAADGNSAALLASLHIIACVKGFTTLAD